MTQRHCTKKAGKIIQMIIPDPVLSSATIDRIFDRADISIFKGKSYRLKGKIHVKNIDLKIQKKYPY